MSLKPERVDFPSTWSRLRKTCEEVIRVEKVDKREWSDRFSDVYKLCVAFPEPLSDRLYDEIRSFLEHHVAALYDEMSRTSAGSLLQIYHVRWIEFKQGVSYLNQLYMYLNMQHIKKQKASEADLMFGGVDYGDQKLEIGELGLHLWKVNMIEPMKHDLVTLLLDAIRKDRLGHGRQESIVQGVIMSLVQVQEYKKKGALDLYQTAFEQEFLKSTDDYYKRLADELITGSSCSMYMEKILSHLSGENVRSRRFLHPSSFPKVTSVCEDRLIADHLSFLHSECRSMVHQDMRRDLHNMYVLLKPVEMGLPVLVKELQDHITRTGLEAVCNCLPSSASSASSSSSSSTVSPEIMSQCFVDCVLDVHKKYTHMIREVFNSDQQFMGALDLACSVIVNHRRNPRTQCRSAELLSRYCDSLLKKNIRNMSESEIDEKLSLSITVFKYIDDKDVFQKFYAKMFAKRLIHQLSVSMDAEEGMINKLKNACGYEYTSKFHRMFTDIKLSDDLGVNFDSWLKSQYGESSDPLGIGFSIFVLQAGAWPLGQAAISPFAVPQPLERPVSYFEAFYNKKFNGRKLTWLHHLSTAEMRLTFPDPTAATATASSKVYHVSMGTYHMAILDLFESVNSMIYRDLQVNTKLSDEQLVKHLQSLLEAKLILTHNPCALTPSPTTDVPSLAPDDPAEAKTSSPGPGSSSPSEQEDKSTSLPVTLSPDMMFYLNVNFSNKRTKFKITAVIQKEVQQQVEVEQTHASVDEDRKLYLQAAVVRIVKARKVIKHNSLIEEVIQQSANRFTPNIQMIKKCIESLIDKGYLERKSNASDEYSYIA